MTDGQFISAVCAAMDRRTALQDFYEAIPDEYEIDALFFDWCEKYIADAFQKQMEGIRVQYIMSHEEGGNEQ